MTRRDTLLALLAMPVFGQFARSQGDLVWIVRNLDEFAGIRVERGSQAVNITVDEIWELLTEGHAVERRLG